MSSLLDPTVFIFMLVFGLRLMLPSTLPTRRLVVEAVIAGAGVSIGIWSGVILLYLVSAAE